MFTGRMHPLWKQPAGPGAGRGPLAPRAPPLPRSAHASLPPSNKFSPARPARAPRAGAAPPPRPAPNSSPNTAGMEIAAAAYAFCGRESPLPATPGAQAVAGREAGGWEPGWEPPGPRALQGKSSTPEQPPRILRPSALGPGGGDGARNVTDVHPASWQPKASFCPSCPFAPASPSLHPSRRQVP